jgi:O-antigen ligase
MVMPLLWATAKLLPFSPKAARFTKPVLWATLPLTAFFVFSTFSRSGFIALGVALLSWLSLQRRKFRTVIGVLLLIMAVVPFLPMPEGYLDRLQTIRTFEEEQESSAISRLHFWKVAMSMVAAHPLGVGLFNFEANYDDFDTTDGAWGRNRSVHNSHLQILTELGVIGFALWVFLLISSLIGCLRIRRKADAIGMDTRTGQVLWTLATAIFVSLFAFMVGGLFISMGLNDLTWLMFAAVAALERVASHAANPPAPIVKRASLI